MTLTTLSIKIRYIIKIEKIKNYKCGIFSLSFVIKPGERMTEIFSVGLHKTDKALKA